MKFKPMVVLPLGGLFAAGLLLLVVKALTQKEHVLPPTGSSFQSPSYQIPQLPSSPSSWIDTGKRWGNYNEYEWLEELEEPVTVPSIRASTSSARTASSFSSAAHLIQSPLSLRPEPTIREVQLAAIRYAEVRPEKIQRWRTLSQIRNFIPKFTLGLNRDSDTTIGSSSSNGRTNFTVGPQDESFGVDFGFTWDLANLVWDSAQTSIDVRSRLMVQLRQDILEETTRIYFERQRLRNEFEAAPVDDPILKKERSLRLQELTAQLDAITGGLYSSQESGDRSQE